MDSYGNNRLDLHRFRILPIVFEGIIDENRAIFIYGRLTRDRFNIRYMFLDVKDNDLLELKL